MKIRAKIFNKIRETAFPDYFPKNKIEALGPDGEDTLADFVRIELEETVDWEEPDLTDTDKIEFANQTIENTIDELRCVQDALDEVREELDSDLEEMFDD